MKILVKTIHVHCSFSVLRDRPDSDRPFYLTLRLWVANYKIGRRYQIEIFSLPFTNDYLVESVQVWLRSVAIDSSCPDGEINIPGARDPILSRAA